MNYSLSHIRKPVRRAGAARYLSFTLLSFAASVSLTRLFLSLTGYPQIGKGELHIAHVLWGGLLLFIAALLPLMLANRWAYTWSAMVAGIGVGLFIDEVGKFVTRANDYFYPPAAPIIYAFFLLVVLLYLQIKRRPSADPRSELYRAFDMLEEVLDHDLSERERAEIERCLAGVIHNSKDPNLIRLATELTQFLKSHQLEMVAENPNFIERWLNEIQAFFSAKISRAQLRFALIAGLLLTGLLSVLPPLRLIIQAITQGISPAIVAQLMNDHLISNRAGLNWYAAHLALELTVGIIFFAAVVMLAIRHERRGWDFGYLGLMLSLTTIDLLVFYFDQFSTIFIALGQFILLMGIVYYRRNHLGNNRPY